MADISDILFDLGGVLLTHPRHLTHTCIAEATGLSFGQVHQPWRNNERALRTGRMSISEFLCGLKADYGIPDPVETLTRRYGETYGRYAPVDPVMDGLIATLRKRFRVSAWTNTVDAHYRYNVSRGLFDRFERVFASCEMGLSKPDREAADYVVTQLGVEPGSCLFVDDRQENIDMALSIGMRGYRFTGTSEFEMFLRKEVLI